MDGSESASDPWDEAGSESDDPWDEANSESDDPWSECQFPPGPGLVGPGGHTASGRTPFQSPRTGSLVSNSLESRRLAVEGREAAKPDRPSINISSVLLSVAGGVDGQARLPSHYEQRGMDPSIVKIRQVHQCLQLWSTLLEGDHSGRTSADLC